MELFSIKRDLGVLEGNFLPHQILSPESLSKGHPDSVLEISVNKASKAALFILGSIVIFLLKILPVFIV